MPVKKDANVKITASSRARWVARKHREIIAEATGSHFDVEVDYAYRHLDERDYDWRHLRLRLLGHWDARSLRHRLYPTSAAPHQLSASNAAAVYALRWEIELLFRELKTMMRLEHVPSGNKAASECLLYASLLALAFSRKLHATLIKTRATLARIFDPFPVERWTSVFRSATASLLDLLLATGRRRMALGRRVSRLLLWEARDPNRKRVLLLGRAQAGILQAELASA